MPSRLRKLIETVVYAGLKPSGVKDAAPGQNRGRRFEWLRSRLDRFASGTAPSDPLYLSNRTLGQKLRLPLLIAVPCLMLGVFIFMALSSEYFNPKAAPPPAILSPAELAIKMLPNLGNVKIDSDRDVEVVDVRVEMAEHRLAGTVRNNTAHSIRSTNIVFDLADVGGSRVGAASTQLLDLPPKSSSAFTVPLEARNAAVVMVREIRWR